MDFDHFQPCFLIAMPDLEDPHFARTVVLLTEWGDKGASGFIINRPTTHKVGDTVMLKGGQLKEEYKHYPLWEGGPVEPHKVWVVYDGNVYHDDSDVQLAPRIHLANDMDILSQQATTIQQASLRIIHGCAGWDKQQMINEIAASVWITAKADPQLLFDTPTDQIWNKAIQTLGIDPIKLVGQRSHFLN